MKVIGYIRVSTNEQANEGISIDNQRAKIEAYCQLHGLDLVDIIIDPGRSGKSLNRNGIQNLLNRLDSVNSVVVNKLDRLSRKVLDVLNLIELFESKNIAFHSITEKIDTKSAIGRFFLNIIAALAQMERDLISERTKDVLDYKKSKNERIGSIPYGFSLSTDGKHLINNEKEQMVIRFIKKLNKKGISLRQICDRLAHRGFTPRGGKWHPQTISNILKA